MDVGPLHEIGFEEAREVMLEGEGGEAMTLGERKRGTERQRER